MITKSIIHLLLYIFFLQPIYSNDNIQELKNTSLNDMKIIKYKYLSIKKKVYSPYNKKQINYDHYLDSLQVLSSELNSKRTNLFIKLKEFELSDKDIQFFAKINEKSILLFNIINNFGRMCRSYFYCQDCKGFDLAEYALDTKILNALEQDFSGE